jgi:RHH-type rel operon transcriptional repressor/antitoxin RelB
MSKQTAVRLPDETYQRLQALAQRTGRTATFYIREAIEDHLDDLEDAYLAERALEEMRRDNEPTHSLDELIRELDLESDLSGEGQKAAH